MNDKFPITQSRLFSEILRAFTIKKCTFTKKSQNIQMLPLLLILSSYSIIEPGSDGYCQYSRLTYKCDGVCLYDKKLYCYPNESSIYFCRNPRVYFFIIWACFTGPVLISLIFSTFYLKIFKPPPPTFILNLVMSTLWAVIINGIYCLASIDFEPVNIISVALPGMILLQASCLFLLAGMPCCLRKIYHTHIVKQTMSSPCLKRCELEKYIMKMRTGPPCICLSGFLNTQSVRTVRSSGKTRVRHVTSSTPFQEYHPYVSWEETSDPFKIPNKPLLFIKTDIKFKYTEELKQYMLAKAQQMVRDVTSRGGTASVAPIDTVEGATEFFVASTTDEIPTIQRFTSSCFGKFLWGFLAFLGLHSVYETIYCAHFKFVKFKIRKSISDQPVYHSPAYEPDPDAPTFI